MQAKDILQTSRVIPVITIYDLNSSLDLARALVKGGMKVLEITLRTKDALDAIEIISKEIPEAIVGAGTVLSPQQLEAVLKSGAKFAISPGLGEEVLKEAIKTKAIFIPGVSSSSEVIRALELGFTSLKLFPAEVVGGIKLLQAFQSVFQEVKFCPTGGINPTNMKEYLNLENVLCVGGSWLSPKELVLEAKWEEITQISRNTLALVGNYHE